MTTLTSSADFVDTFLLLGWRPRAEPERGPGLLFAVGLAPDIFLVEPEPLALGVEVRANFFLVLALGVEPGGFFAVRGNFFGEVGRRLLWSDRGASVFLGGAARGAALCNRRRCNLRLFCGSSCRTGVCRAGVRTRWISNGHARKMCRQEERQADWATAAIGLWSDKRY